MDYKHWCSLSDDELRQHDVAELNLLAAAGLPGSEQLDIPALLRTVDAWTEQVREFTQRNWRRFKASPREFNHSPGQFRMLSLVTVVQRDLKAMYRPDLIGGDYDASDSRPWFIHGLLTGFGGTCVSIPILYLAIGRRLGYPLHLVEAKEHLFVRWEAKGGERFNVEGSGRGFSAHPDEYYHHRPKPITRDEFRYMLKNLSPREELAASLMQRARCLLDDRQTIPAIEAFRYTAELAPDNGGHWGAMLVAVMMHRILEQFRNHPSSTMLSMKVLEEATPPLKESWERWAAPIAREELKRVALLHRRKSMTDVHDRLFADYGR